MKAKSNELVLTSIEDTLQAIRIVKKRIRIREEILEEQLQKFPEEVIKSSVNKIIPAFINSKITGNTWNIIKNLFGQFAPFSNKRNSLLNSVVQNIDIIGLVITGLIKLFGKRSDKTKKEHSGKRSNAAQGRKFPSLRHLISHEGGG